MKKFLTVMKRIIVFVLLLAVVPKLTAALVLFAAGDGTRQDFANVEIFGRLCVLAAYLLNPLLGAKLFHFHASWQKALLFTGLYLFIFVFLLFLA